MINLLKAEFYKLFHSPSFWGLALCAFFLSSLMLLDSLNQTGSLFCASLYNTPILYFFTILFCTLFVGEDLDARTLSGFVSAGQGRGTVLFAKLLVYQAGGVLLLGAPLAVHGLAGLLLLHGVIPAPAVLLTDGAVLLSALVAMGMLPLCCAFAFRDVGRTLVAPMLLYFMMIFLLNGDMAQLFSVILPIGQLRLLSLQALPHPATAVGINLLWIAALYGGAVGAFCRADLK